MAAVYQDILYWGCLGMANFGISVLVYYSTRTERKQKIIFDTELSTRTNVRRITTLPCSFTFLSMLTGLLNFGGAFFRSRHIQLLEIPTTWLTKGAVDAGDNILLSNLIQAEWVVAVNDWGSLFLSVAFFLAGCFNFATVRQLRLRSCEEKEDLLPLAVEKSFLRGQIAGFGGVVDESVFVRDEKMEISV